MDIFASEACVLIIFLLAISAEFEMQNIFTWNLDTKKLFFKNT